MSTTEIRASADELVAGNNQFALDLYARLRDQAGNLAFSPFSVSASLAMTYAGARGETAIQLARALRFGDPAAVHPAFKSLLDRLADQGAAKPYLLAVANALWTQRDAILLADFAATLRRDYSVPAYQADFRSAAEAARRAINNYVEENTNDRIRNLLQEPPAPDTSLILVNAVYFKGDWAEPFEERRTRTEDFFLSRDVKVPARMMHRTDGYRYRHFTLHGFRALRLPYVGDELSMLVLLPDAVDGLARLEDWVLRGDLAFLGNLPRREVAVSLPRFRVEARFSLAGALQELGVTAAFSPGLADFSGMDGTRELFLSDVIHQALVETNEQGTEAAAASACVLERTCGGIDLPGEEFRADHPFLFLVVDDRSGSVLFLGRVAEPSA